MQTAAVEGGEEAWYVKFNAVVALRNGVQNYLSSSVSFIYMYHTYNFPVGVGLEAGFLSGVRTTYYMAIISVR